MHEFNAHTPPAVEGENRRFLGAFPYSFTPRAGTYILLFFLIVLWPAIGLSILFIDDTSLDWELLDPVWFIYVPTIIIQWLIFIAVVLGIYRERSSFASIGLARFRVTDILRAVLFLIISNLTLSLLQIFLSTLGLTVSKEVDALVEQGTESMWWWLAVSVTAAICEETAFRGYIMTRVKGIFGAGGWMVPVLLSSVSFAAGHTYQGIGGVVLLFIYGAMFCGLFLYTRSLWPGIIAHFIQNFSAIFLYRYTDF